MYIQGRMKQWRRHLSFIVLYYTILYYAAILYHTILYCIVGRAALLGAGGITGIMRVGCRVQCNILNGTVQSTVSYDILNGTVQSTAQSTAQSTLRRHSYTTGQFTTGQFTTGQTLQDYRTTGQSCNVAQPARKEAGTVGTALHIPLAVHVDHHTSVQSVLQWHYCARVQDACTVQHGRRGPHPALF